MRISDWSSDVCSSDLLADAQEVSVDRAILDRVESDVLRQGSHLLATDIDHHDRVHEVTRHQLLHQQLFFDVDNQGFFFAAIDNAGDTAVKTKVTRRTGA